MIFQDPLSALHPYYTHRLADRGGLPGPPRRRQEDRQARGPIEMLDRVGIPEPAKRFDDYPHEFSGGMRQRAMIAMSLVNNPELLIADEPTTALDVTVQAQILDLIRDLQKEFGSAVIIITHDLGVVAEIADDLLVMYGGRCIERGTGREGLLRAPAPVHLGPAGLDAAHRPGADRPAHPGQGLPAVSLINVPSGCAFNPRCPYAGRAQGQHHPHRAPGAAADRRRRALLRLPHVAGRSGNGSGPKRLRRSCELSRRSRRADGPTAPSTKLRSRPRRSRRLPRAAAQGHRPGQSTSRSPRAC